MASTEKDCPINKGYNICTCDMCGEEIALVEWKIKQQEGRLPWWSIFARASIAGAPWINKYKETK